MDTPLAKRIKKDNVNDSNQGVSLNDLFADDVKPDKDSLAANLASMSDLKNPMVMLTYYRRLFPFRPLFKWLNHGEAPSKNFTNREFAFTLQNETYLRYNSFTTAEDLKKEIVRLNPSRFEIGPVYTGKPKDKKTLLKSAFKPILRELVFDIDMTDYDSMRTCCQDKAMCQHCWQFIAVAVEVLDKALRDDFGFKHLLWVYSGRRGIHLWISDPEALALSDEQRKAIVNYVEIIKGEKKMNLIRPLHPSLSRALKQCTAHFQKLILEDQNCFAADAQWDNLLALLPNKEYATFLKKQFASSDAKSEARWQAVLNVPPRPKLTTLTPKQNEIAADRATAKYKEVIQEIVLSYTYPRIDTEVSKKMNHLLKSPFCIHPGTGKVCVPLEASQVKSFNPDSCPTVGQLLMELEEAAKIGETSASWERTSLRPFVETFERHCDGILKEVSRDRKENISMEF